MPITLPPFSRRRFLGASLGGLMGGLVPRPGARAGTAADPSSWILFSDAHVAADREIISRGVKMAANLEACVAQALAGHAGAAGVLLTGDCAYLNGNPGDYATLESLLKPLRAGGLPVHLLVGNHDHREHFLGAFASPGAPSPVEHRAAAFVRSPLVNWFLLDSLDRTNHTPGLLGPEQRAWLEETLDAHRSKPAVIVVHHNVLPFAQDSSAATLAEALHQPVSRGALQDSADLLAILRPRRQVKACVFGHTHAWSVLRDASGIHLINLPPTAYVFRSDMPNGWVHAALRTDGMTLRLNCLDPAHSLHGARADLAWRPA